MLTHTFLYRFLAGGFRYLVADLTSGEIFS